nr:hypothetical protein StreXyl84_01680 [Streptomyces sp. Xyl84]
MFFSGTQELSPSHTGTWIGTDTQSPWSCAFGGSMVRYQAFRGQGIITGVNAPWREHAPSRAGPAPVGPLLSPFVEESAGGFTAGPLDEECGGAVGPPRGSSASRCRVERER